MPISPSLIKVSPLTPSTSTGPLMRHRNYFIHKADLTIRVENDIFKIHRYFLTRESAHFRLLLSAPTLLGQEPPGSSESNPLVLNDVTSEAFASFLWTFYNSKYSLYEATSDEWCSILELARKWGFRDVEQLCIRELENLDLSPVERIPIYQRFNLSETRLLDCYESLTIRDDPIGVEEGIKLGVRTSVQIACAREVARASETGGGLSPSPVQRRGPGLRSLISEIFQSPPSPTNRTAWSLNTPLSDSNGVSDLFTPAPTVRGAPTGGRSTPQLAIQTNGMSSSALTSHRGGSVWQSPAMWSAMATRLDHPLARSTGTRSTSNPVTTLAPQPQSPRAPVGRVWSLGGLGLPSGPEAGGNAATRLERVGTQSITGSVRGTRPERTPSQTTEEAKLNVDATSSGSKSPLPHTTPTSDPALYGHTHIPIQFKRQNSPILASGQLNNATVPSFQAPKPIIVPTPIPAPAFTTPDPTAHTHLPIQFKRQSGESVLFDFLLPHKSQGDAPIAGSSKSHQERADAEVKEQEQADNKARVADAEEEKAAEAARVKAAAAEIEAKKPAKRTAGAEANARRVKGAKSNAESESKAKTESEPKAKADTGSKVKADTESKAKVNTGPKAKADTESKAKADAGPKAKADTESKNKADKEPKAKANTESKAKGPKAKVDIESKAKAETAAKSSDAEARAKRDAEAKTKEADAKAKAKDDAEAELQKARGDAELQKTKRGAQAKVKDEVETKVKPDAKAEKAQLGADADIKAKTVAETKGKAKTKAEAETNTSQMKTAELVKAPGNKAGSSAVISKTERGEDPSSWVVLDGLPPSTTTAAEKEVNYLTDSDSDDWDSEDSEWQEQE